MKPIHEQSSADPWMVNRLFFKLTGLAGSFPGYMPSFRQNSQHGLAERLE